MHARPLQRGQITARDEARFWAKVEKTAGCWLWTAAATNGYGTFYLNGGYHRAHRVAFILSGGSLEGGDLEEMMHTCDVRRCVRPEHLRAGTRAMNMQDMSNKGRGNWQTKPDTVLRGEQNGNSRLNAAIVKQIRSLYRSGLKQAAISAQIGVTQATISQIVMRKTWRHID